MRKFSMNLVWHNCHEYPPEEPQNDSLVVTNGTDIHKAKWLTPGFFVYTNTGWYMMKDGDYSNWWWADIHNTVHTEPRFRTNI